ncbi:heterokaryon incompatibility protein, partial [Cucurbitaria berberidis CBS 394.84]
MASPYRHQPLCRSRREIRLLQLLPEDGNPKLKRIPSCRIHRAALPQKPKFIALSYVWGDVNETRMILVDGSQVRVTKNLYNAMMALRPSKEPTVIWIDSLCIDQMNNEEKSWQVGLMADIYQHADKVIAWLGPADEDSDSVMDGLNSLGTKAEALGMHFGPPDLDQRVWQELALNPAPTAARSSQSAPEKLFYSISGYYDKSGVLPIAGLKRFFGRAW